MYRKVPYKTVQRDQLSQLKRSLLDPEWVHRDTLTLHRYLQLKTTITSLLPTDTDNASGILPLGYTLGFCNPISPLKQLGLDGFDNYHTPLVPLAEGGLGEPFERRMWLSGTLTMNKPLKIGDHNVTLNEKVKDVRCSKFGILVTYERTFRDAFGGELVELRKFGFLPDKYKETYQSENESEVLQDSVVVVQPDLVSSFRISALCFNGHKIHYDKSYAATEGYPNIVIEAPMLILLALENWQQHFPHLLAYKFDYKIKNPVFVDEQIKLSYEQLADNEWKLLIQKSDSTILEGKLISQPNIL